MECSSLVGAMSRTLICWPDPHYQPTVRLGPRWREVLDRLRRCQLPQGVRWGRNALAGSPTRTRWSSRVSRSERPIGPNEGRVEGEREGGTTPRGFRLVSALAFDVARERPRSLVYAL